MKTVGILALQGDFEAHAKAIEKAGGRATEVRSREQIELCDGLILPGGESSTMLKLLNYENLLEPLRAFGQHKPIYGTCAGAILVAKEVSHPAQPSLGLMDIDVERNGYGRQIDSRVARLDLDSGDPFEAVFIRAPIIRRAGPEVRVLAKYNGDPVWAEQGRHMVTTFHPELTGDLRVHQRFLERSYRDSMPISPLDEGFMDAVLKLHRMWLSNPSEGRQADLSGVPLNLEDFIEADLRCLLAVGASFRETRFYDVNLSGSDMSGACFYHARLHHSRLRELKAKGSNFVGAKLDHCDFSSAELAGANFYRAQINACIFRAASLQNCDFREARIRGADFRGANLVGSGRDDGGTRFAGDSRR